MAAEGLNRHFLSEQPLQAKHENRSGGVSGAQAEGKPPGGTKPPV